MIEGLTLYNFFFEMIISLVLFVCGIKRKQRFWLRFVLSLVVIGAAWYVFLFIIPETWRIWNIAKYVILFCMFLVGVWLCFEVDFTQSCFCCIAGFALQHGVCKINVFARLLFAMGGHDMIWLYYIITPLIYGVLFLLYFKKAKNGMALGQMTKVQIPLGIAMLFIATVVSQVFDMEFCRNNINAYMAFVGLDAFMSLMVLLMQFALYKNAELGYDMMTMERLHEAELKQMERTDELIESINIKSHDLKHKLLGMKEKPDEEEINEILNAISLYDSMPQTENALLNAVLAQKQLTMKSENIAFSPIIDATELGMLNKSDMLALFGNIIDNAIEAVRKLPDGQRCIVMTIKNLNGFVSVHCENEYLGSIELTRTRGGVLFPKTTKSDGLSHGFGMKSIKYIVEKYGGTMAITADDNVFKLDILLPFAKKIETTEKSLRA